MTNMQQLIDLHGADEENRDECTRNKYSISYKSLNVDHSFPPQNTPVLEAGDLKTLLEQFEASEVQQRSCNLLETELQTNCIDNKFNIKQKFVDTKSEMEMSKSGFKNDIGVEENCQSSMETKSVKINSEGHLMELSGIIKEAPYVRKENKACEKKISTTEIPPLVQKHFICSKDVPEMLPLKVEGFKDQFAHSKLRKPVSSLELVHLDHDYCHSSISQCQKQWKDLDFKLIEDGDIADLSQQPMNKNTDESLLKVNTVNNTVRSQKKKLNLEEYKLRRAGLIEPPSSLPNSFQICSRGVSNLPDDGNLTPFKHEKKLMKDLLLDILNSSPELENKFKTCQFTTFTPNTSDIKLDLETSLEPLEQLMNNSLLNQASENILEGIDKSPVFKNPVGQIKRNGYSNEKPFVYLSKRRKITKTRTEAESDKFVLKNHISCRSRSIVSSQYKRSTSSPNYSSSQILNHKELERIHEVEERRIIYVGCISSSCTKEDLRKRFQIFGPISNISLHFREHGENYGFVTFANKLDAYKAIEHGNDNLNDVKYNLSFGGRRLFCKTSYSDLDNVETENNCHSPRKAEDSFDTLLKKAQQKLHNRKA